MKAARLLALTGSMGLAVSFMAAGVASASTHSSPNRVTLAGSAPAAKALAHPDGKVAASSSVSFDLSLKLRNAAGAARFAMAVSTPKNKSFHKYLTDAKWEAKYGPSRAEANAAVKWLRHEGFKVGAVAKDRLFVSASGPASRVERTFGVSLGYYTVTGHKLRLAKGNLSIPASMSGTISGVTGVSQVMETTSLTTNLSAAASKAKPADAEPGPPAGYRNPQPCSAYWGQKTDTADSPSLYAPYTNAAYDICGYKPGQLRSAYGLAGSHIPRRGVAA